MRGKQLAWRLVQATFVVAVLWYGARLLAAQWSDVRALRATVRTDWRLLVQASLLVLVSYAVLIATWRATVQAWGERISIPDATRIWFISNLGRYLPGKVWQIGAMGVMAQRVGVSPVAAVGSALVVSLVHVLVGFAVVATSGRSLLAVAWGGSITVIVALVAMGVAVIGAPWLVPMGVRLAARLTGRPLTEPHLPARAIWIAAAGSAAAWILFGVAFRILASALLGQAAGAVPDYVAVFTLSYLIGFLALPAPGGIGVREVSLASLLVTSGLAMPAEAAWLVVGSRLWLTVLEILPGGVLLLFPARRPESPSATS